MDYYAKIDSAHYYATGEIKVIEEPKSWKEIMEEGEDEFPHGGFHIHRPDVLFKFIEALGGKKGKVATYMLREKDSRNICMLRVEDLARGAGVALQTANETLKILRASGCIKTRTGLIMTNPGIDRTGNKKREAYLMKLYETFDSRTRRTIDKNDEEEV